jgi:3-isopropylmalate/(R)-2-methylmalate dehydratase small subunit
MAQFTTLTSRVVPLLIDNIDTDQIIPARFLKATDKLGLGENLFSDWRFNADGSLKPDFVLNRPEHRGATILLAGDNFGCGSSREHAPWALTGYGFRAVISTSFADIFRSNALKNGLLPVRIGPEEHRSMVDLLTRTPDGMLTISLAAQTVTRPDGRAIRFPIDDFSRTCLLDGVDELGYLLGFREKIREYEQTIGRP